MNINDIKKLCNEHQRLSDTNKSLEIAFRNDRVVAIDTSYGVFELNYSMACLVKNANNMRIKEIEKILGSEDK